MGGFDKGGLPEIAITLVDVKHLNPKLVWITSKRTQHFTVTKIMCLVLVKEVIKVYPDNLRKPIG
jgi:hypothetical protein